MRAPWGAQKCVVVAAARSLNRETADNLASDASRAQHGFDTRSDRNMALTLGATEESRPWLPGAAIAGRSATRLKARCLPTRSVIARIVGATPERRWSAGPCTRK